nr:ATP-binding protein [Geothrix sp. SG198]
MAGQARGIRPETLGSRLERRGIPLELDPLAEAINTTLDRLETAFARLSGLNADLAHELRSPLHALRLELEFLLQRAEIQPDLADRLGGWMEDIDHLIAVIEQMLFLAQTEEPTHLLSREEIQAEVLLQSLFRPFLALAEDRGITLVPVLDKAFSFRGDPTLLRQALHNLLTNAIRHSPDGGAVTVTAAFESGGPMFTVQDQGPGLPPGLLPEVGRRFLKGGEGAGLGLAIASRIAQLHGGSLSIENLDPGGARARLLLG